jgi:nicotinamide-nucleotide amidase
VLAAGVRPRAPQPSEAGSVRAHVLSIGSELILGHLTDTNATFLAQELVASGIELLHVTQVGDDRGRIAATLRQALDESELVACTGGIGPTEDDLTREAIADVVGQTPEVDADLRQGIEAYFAARGLTMPERNAKQAWLIPSAEALPNPIGTAPGWLVRHDDRTIVAMPGVPREMYRMWREQAMPRIAANLPARSVQTVTLRTLGIGESAAEQLLDDLVRRANPVVATYAKDDGVHVRVTAAADTGSEAVRLRDEAAADVRTRLRRFIYGTDDTTLPRALGDRLQRRALSIAVGERGTGGRLASMLASVPTTPAFRGGFALPLDSQAFGTATELADRARDTFDAALGLGIVTAVEFDPQAIASGTVEVAITGAIQTSETFQTRAAFEDMQRRAALSAADVLRRALDQAK